VLGLSSVGPTINARTKNVSRPLQIDVINDILTDLTNDYANPVAASEPPFKKP